MRAQNGEPSMPKRLPSSLVTALDIIAAHGSPRISLGDFDLRMQQKGLAAFDTKVAVAMLERRQWAVTIDYNVIFTETGMERARAPYGCTVKKARPKRKSPS